MTPATDTRRLTLAATALFVVVVLVRPGPLALFGTDAACYARIARDLAGRSLSTWADVQSDAGAFHEHPPLALWLEAAWFRVFGASAAAAVWLARLYALALGAVVWRTARHLIDATAAAVSLAALVALPDFVFESQNLMLEAPLTLAFAGALQAITRVERSQKAVGAFAACVVAAFWVKGIVALGAGALLVWALWRGAGWKRVGVAALASVGLLVVTAAAYEAWCRALGVSSFFNDYAHKQLAASFTEGRGNPIDDPFFYGNVLLGWYLPFVLSLPVATYLYRRESAPWRALVSLAATHAAIVVLGFSAAKQKNLWYLAPILPAAAWLVGATLATLLRRWVRAMPWVLAAACLCWGAWTFVSTRFDTQRETAVRAVTSTQLDAAQASVANCSALGDWVALQLFAFHWNARAVTCESPARWRFDGVSLIEQPDAR